jgi:hypothetical protein
VYWYPKSERDCWIFEVDLQTVNKASKWFKTRQNLFIRTAREHREEQRW